MKNKLFISVILPIYNAEQFLLETLVSLSNQTYDNFEIIAIDDGSTDSSLEILREYSLKEKRLKIVTRENKKLIATLNEGIELATGEYIARMDADDIALPTRFEKQIKYLEDNKLDICGGWVQCFGDSTEIRKLPETNNELRLLSIIECPMMHPTILGKTEVFKKYKYQTDDLHAEDYGLWCRMLIDGIKLGNIPEVVLNYRVSADQIGSKFSDIQKNTANKIRKNYIELLPEFKDMKIANSFFYFDWQCSNDFMRDIYCLNAIYEKISDKVTLELFENFSFRMLINASYLGVISLRKALKRLKIRITVKQKLILFIFALFKIQKLKCSIRKNRFLTILACKILNYK